MFDKKGPEKESNTPLKHPMTKPEAVAILLKRMNASADMFDPEYRDALILAVHALAQVVQTERDVAGRFTRRPL